MIHLRQEIEVKMLREYRVEWVQHSSVLKGNREGRCYMVRADEDFEPIRVDLKEENMVIEGVVVGLVRNGMPLH